MNKKAIIFDLDGVIVDTAKYHFLAWRELANSLGVDFTEEQNEQLKGVSRIASLKKILTWGNIEISEQKFTELMDKKNRDYLAYVHKMNDAEILPGVPKILNFLLEHKIPFALGSASKNAKLILQKIGLFYAFETIVDGNSVSKAKPDPEVFLQASRELSVKPQDCIVFEDSVAGVQAANRAGMISIGIGNKKVLHEANYVFENFTKIKLDFIEEILKEEVSIS